LQHMRIAVAFVHWNFLLLENNKKNSKQANATAIRICCKMNLPLIYSSAFYKKQKQFLDDYIILNDAKETSRPN